MNDLDIENEARWEGEKRREKEFEELKAKLSTTEKALEEARSEDRLRGESREWVRCPVCGEPDMRKEYFGEEKYPLIFCVNHGCKSNGGDNHDALQDQPQQFLTDLKAALERAEGKLNEESAAQATIREHLARIEGLEEHNTALLAWIEKATDQIRGDEALNRKELMALAVKLEADFPLALAQQPDGPTAEVRACPYCRCDDCECSEADVQPDQGDK